LLRRTAVAELACISVSGAVAGRGDGLTGCHTRRECLP
jgi:hypothetical protein